MQPILSIFGIFTYLHGLIRDYTFIHFGGKNSVYTVIGDKYLQMFLIIFCFKALVVQKHVFFKLWTYGFVNRIAFTCTFGIWISKWRTNLPTWLLDFWKKSYLHGYWNLYVYWYLNKYPTYTVIRSPRLFKTSEYLQEKGEIYL
jgi:hypothetical protein